VLGQENVNPQVAGNTYTWEFRNLPPIEHEDYGPPFIETAPRLAVSYFPPAGNPAGLEGLKDWTAVSVWMSRFMDSAAEVTESVRAKASEITANASDSLAKIRAIGEFVQKTNYVEVDLNLTRGGGYTPHKAAETLARNAGDCKDKASLMRAMLKSIGIDSWVVAIRATNRDFVKPEWASPQQFNHAILAVAVPESVNLPTVIRHPVLGNLLLFDPTDSITALGSLPIDEQGSRALILAGDKGTLAVMPQLPPDANRIESFTQGAIDASGALQATIRREYFGQSSIPVRAVEKLRGKGDLQKLLERRLNRLISGASVDGVNTETNPADNHMSLALSLTAGRFAQSMQNKLLIVRPGLLTSGGEYYFSSDRRVTPIKLNADLRRDTIRIRIPEGFKVDERPWPAKVEGAYGRLETSWEVKDGELVMTQVLEVRPVTIPPSDYTAVRKFFDQLGGAQTAPVVLVRE
jgi:hypothetical protein